MRPLLPHKSIPSPLPQPVSTFSTIRTVRNRRRNVRSEVAGEVEKALEDLERMVGGRAPKQVIKGVNMKGCERV